MVAAETELGPGDESDLVLGDALEPERVAFVGLVHKVGPGPVHGSGPGAEAEYEFGAGVEVVWVSQWSQQRTRANLSCEPALPRLEFETSAAWTRRRGAGLVLETEGSEMPGAKG